MNYSTLNSDCVQLKYGTFDKAGLELQSILKFTRHKMDMQYRLSSPSVLSRQHLEIYKDKFVNSRGLSNHRNKIQR